MNVDQFIQIVGPTVAAVVGLLWYIQRREDKMVGRMNQMEKDMGNIKTNYISRFQEMHDTMQDVKVETLNALHELETNLRTSVHGLREDLAKFFGRMEGEKK